MAKRGRPSLTHGWPACASKYLKLGTRPLLRYRSGEFTPSSRLSPCGGQPLSRAIFRPELEASDRSGSRGFRSWVLGEVSKTLSKAPVFCFQQLAASFPKTPRVGVPQHFRATLCFRRHIRHEAPPSPVVSTGCAYFLSPQGCATPLPRPKGEGPARCSPCRRQPRPGGQSFRDFQTFRPLRSPLVTGHSPLRFPLQWVT
jgi:hypothetical protein